MTRVTIQFLLFDLVVSLLISLSATAEPTCQLIFHRNSSHKLQTQKLHTDIDQIENYQIPKRIQHLISAIQTAARKGNLVHDPDLALKSIAVALVIVDNGGKMLMDELIQTPGVLDSALLAKKSTWNESELLKKAFPYPTDFRDFVINYWYYSNRHKKEPAQFSNLIKLLSLERKLYENDVDFINDATNTIFEVYHSEPIRIEGISSLLPNYVAFKLIKERIRSELKIPNQVVQDIAVLKQHYYHGDRKIEIVAFSTNPIEGGFETPFGFYLKLLDQKSISIKQFAQSYSWNSAGNNHLAEVSYKIVPSNEVAPLREISPRYHDMWSDQKLGGMILISKNMYEFGPELALTYREYLLSEGFKISRTQVLDANFAYAHILNRVKSGDVDYILREGHTEISPESLVALGSQIQFFTATRKNEKKSEVIHVYFEKYTGKESSRSENSLSLSQLGNAIRSRTNPNRQLVYFDSACVSHCNTVTRIEQVASKAFTPVASNELMETFTQTPGDANFEFLNGIRTGKSWGQIAKRIDPSQQIVFPDQGDLYLTQEQLKDLQPIELHITRKFNLD